MMWPGRQPVSELFVVWRSSSTSLANDGWRWSRSLLVHGQSPSPPTSFCVRPPPAADRPAADDPVLRPLEPRDPLLLRGTPPTRPSSSLPSIVPRWSTARFTAPFLDRHMTFDVHFHICERKLIIQIGGPAKSRSGVGLLGRAESPTI